MARPNTNLIYNRAIVANPGIYSLAGQDVTLIYNASGGLLNGSENDGTTIGNNGDRDLSLGAWGTQHSNFTSGITDPSGSSEASKMVEVADTNVHRCYQLSNFTIPVAGNAQVTFSVYAKAASRQYLILGLEDSGGNGFSANFDVSGGLTGGVNASAGNGAFISASIANGAASFFKCSVKGRISTGAVGSAYLFIAMASVGSTASIAASYTGDGSSGIAVWRPKITQP